MAVKTCILKLHHFFGKGNPCDLDKPPVANDPVNHPSHYTAGNIEVIDFIEDQKLSYHLGSAMKYICRAGRKNPDKTVEDLQKAVWYISRYIGLLEKKQKDWRRMEVVFDGKSQDVS